MCSARSKSDSDSDSDSNSSKASDDSSKRLGRYKQCSKSSSRGKDRVRERGCSSMYYSGGKRKTKPKGTLAREREALGEHNPRGARGRHVEDGGFSFAEHPCATQRPTRNDVRLVSGVAGKMTVAASRPRWITMRRVVCLGVSRSPML